jgi:hypothetical protein
MTRYLAAFVRNGDPNANLDGLPHWKPWSNEEGAAKTIVFDVDGDEADISMMTQEYTRDSIYETMRRELSPELYADVEGRVRRR